jgi:hypothetical protein
MVGSSACWLVSPGLLLILSLMAHRTVIFVEQKPSLPFTGAAHRNIPLISPHLIRHSISARYGMSYTWLCILPEMFFGDDVFPGLKYTLQP